MGHRIIGIEIDEDLLRVAALETGLRRIEVKSVFETTLKSESSDKDGGETARRSPNILETINRHLSEPLGPTDSIAISLSGDKAFFRRLAFPFKDQGRIRAALPYQLIGQIPLQIGDIHCAFEIIPPEEGSKKGAMTEVLAVAVRKADLVSFLSEVEEGGITPFHVTVDGLCLGALLPYWRDRDREVTSMLLYVGQKHGEVIIAKGSRIQTVRTFSIGEPVFGGEEVSPAFMREVLLTAAGASEAGLSIDSIFVTGLEAERLLGPLREVLGVECKVLEPSTLDIPCDCPGLDHRFAKALAIGLGALGGGGPGTINLLVGEFQREASFGLLREHWRFFVFALVLFFLLGAGRFAGRVVGLVAERKAVVAELRSVTKALFGNEMEDFEGALNKVKSISEEDIRVFPQWTAVDILGKLLRAGREMGVSGSSKGEEGDQKGVASNVIRPEDTLAVEFESIRIDQKTMAVRGEADSIETLDALVAKLKGDPCFREVTTESTERIQFQRHQGWQRFSLKVEIDCSKAVEGEAKVGQGGSR